MKRYNLINNSLGWLCFLISAVTYLLTIEPTASFWDCPEFISQGAKLEVGHPPGNPIFMLTARFFVTIFGGDITKASVAVNSMSALLSAATILLLFWTITHLVRKIIVRDTATDISLPKMLVIMGAGVCGALAYTWSDTFWFSAVEGEVYAFSSFCTALVFWLILKWENRADEPHSDRYLVLIAYVIGVSIAVHLLNLLCIPAIVLVFYYRKYKETDAKGSLIALGISVVLVALILYGLVPGFVKVAQGFELFFVNAVGMSYNMGVLIYGIVLLATFIATMYCLYTKQNEYLTKGLVLLTLMLSGITFMTGSALIWLALVAGFAIFIFVRKINRRIYTVSIISIFVIFIGYSSYALLLIRASANTPMNQNAPDNVFTLSSYLNREQYGKTPLFRGPVFTEELAFENISDGQGGAVTVVRVDKQGYPVTSPGDAYLRNPDGGVVDNGQSSYTKVAKTSPDQPDKYVAESYSTDYEVSPDVKMLFTRMYSTDPSHVAGYKSWSQYSNPDIDNLSAMVPADVRQRWAAQGYAPAYELMQYLTHMTPVKIYTTSTEPDTYVWKPTFADNIRYFLNYQLNHMYWRYFMWNFAGRQNDIQGNGEPHLGNWISGIPFIDNMRLGDQSVLPAEFTTENKGHNVFYMLPLLMGLIGLLWQSLFPHRDNPKRGIEQFWVVFFLFFMTGIAIVLYLNQTTGQPRERDYAFAGSFYAFAIWVGMGVPAIYAFATSLFTKKKMVNTEVNGKKVSEVVYQTSRNIELGTAAVAAVIGLIVPLQMVSQTWDDHDRSHRYTTRDFGENYLNSLAPNAIIFTNGDNDTFPLWYAQEVEGVRTDVRVVNLSYLSTDWYANQLTHPYYDAKAVKMTAKPSDYAYNNLAYSLVRQDDTKAIEALDALKEFYASAPIDYGRSKIKAFTHPNAYAPIDFDAMMKVFNIDPNSTDSITKMPYMMSIPMRSFTGRGIGLNELLSFDIVANAINDNFERPVYFATTVPDSYYLNLSPNLSMTGLAYQVTPFFNAEVSPMVETAYENILSKFRWGGLDDPKHNSKLYLDETVRRMVSTNRSAMLETATQLYASGDLPASQFAKDWAKTNGKPLPANRFDMARTMLNYMEEKLPAHVMPYEGYSDLLLSTLYMNLYNATDNADDLARAEKLIDAALERYSQFSRWGLTLKDYEFDNLGSSEQIVRFHFPMYIAYKNLLELNKKLKTDPEANAEALRTFDMFVDSNLRAQVYPMLFITADSPKDFLDMADLYTEYNKMDVAEEFKRGAALAALFDSQGFDRKAEAQKLAQKYGLTLEQLVSLNPYVQ